jgi:NAD(P)-dependent dehydrogenase (short-subunit alcohol dehydrogenase family)
MPKPERNVAMDLQISGKRALVTGGSKGIGRAAAEILAAEGCDLLLAARDAATLAQTAAAIRDRYQVSVEVLAADLSQDAEVLSLAAAAGRVDILVNNAGAIPPGTLQGVDQDTWRRAWDLKVFGFIGLTRAIYAGMAARGSGVVVNVIGAAGEKFPPAYIAGASGNAALMGFTKALGKASAKDGIRVVGINPGPVATERLEMLARHQAKDQFGDAERWQDMFSAMPFARPAKPEEIGHAVAFLASPRSGYTSGTILTIDGGG